MGFPELLIATNNSNKISEFQRLLDGVGCRISTPAGIGLELDVKETGSTFRANANLKAMAFAKKSGLPSLADDSGIEVTVLNGAPGIYSARYGGSGLSDVERVRLLLHEIRDVPWARRQCRYVAALVLAWPNGRLEHFEGICHGMVALKPAGTHGFGYDPIFYVPGEGRTMAELTAGQKDAISHRGLATCRARKLINHENASIRE